MFLGRNFCLILLQFSYFSCGDFIHEFTKFAESVNAFIMLLTSYSKETYCFGFQSQFTVIIGLFNIV